jgi:hypothetical protein
MNANPKRRDVLKALAAAGGLTALGNVAAATEPPERPQKKANSEVKVLAGEVAIDGACKQGQCAYGEIKFPREFPKPLAVFLTETNHGGGFLVFKADEVSTKGIKWAGCKLFGPEEYKTNLAWLAVLPD